MTFLQQVIGAAREPLAYVIREDVMPVGANEATQRMYELPHQGATHTTDNTRVHTLLKSYLADTSGHEWIRAFDGNQDGRAAYLALRAHYNGEGELRKRTTLATETLRTAHYKNELRVDSTILESSFSRLVDGGEIWMIVLRPSGLIACWRGKKDCQENRKDRPWLQHQNLQEDLKVRLGIFQESQAQGKIDMAPCT